MYKKTTITLFVVLGLATEITAYAALQRTGAIDKLARIYNATEAITTTIVKRTGMKGLHNDCCGDCAFCQFLEMMFKW